MLEQVLTLNGFSKKEATIYLAVLSSGEATAGAIANKTKLKRSTVYTVVEELVKKSILSVSNRKGIKRISALPPQALIERFRHSVATAESSLPTLLEMAYSSPVKPRLQFYEGLDGIMEVITQINAINNAEPGMIVTDYSKMPEKVWQKIIQTGKKRERTKNRLKIIVPPNQKNIEVQAKEEENNHYAEHRIAEFTFTDVPLELSLFDNTKVAFMSFEPGANFAVILDSAAIYNTLKNLFLFIWKHGAPRRD